MKKIKVIIHGRVQKVGFRNWVKYGMKKFGVTGEVWNLPAQAGNEGGAVEGEFEGDEENLEKLIERCKKGSPLSRVTKVDILEL